MLTPNIEQAHKFLGLLSKEEIFTFQTFDDSDQERGNLARVFHGTLAEYAKSLTKLNQQGAGVFVMINEGDGVKKLPSKTCRTNANVIAVRALFLDLDGAPLEPVLEAGVAPNIVVESSTGKWHIYWKTTDTPLEDFKERQLALAEKFDGDPTVNDRARVMRLPGFYHQKNEPVMTRIIAPVFA